MLMGVKEPPRKSVRGEVVVLLTKNEPPTWVKTNQQHLIWKAFKEGPATIAAVAEELDLRNVTVLRTVKPWVKAGLMRSLKVRGIKENILECSEHLE